jgi:hypothetical protein
MKIWSDGYTLVLRLGIFVEESYEPWPPLYPSSIDSFLDDPDLVVVPGIKPGTPAQEVMTRLLKLPSTSEMLISITDGCTVSDSMKLIQKKITEAMVISSEYLR